MSIQLLSEWTDRIDESLGFFSESRHILAAELTVCRISDAQGRPAVVCERALAERQYEQKWQYWNHVGVAPVYMGLCERRLYISCCLKITYSKKIGAGLAIEQTAIVERTSVLVV